MASLLTIENLIKKFPDSDFSVGPIDLVLESGSVLALLGENGAGKSTFFNLLTGNLEPTKGTVKLENQLIAPESYEVKRKIGYLPQNLSFPDWITGKEILTYSSMIHNSNNPKNSIDHQIDTWQLANFIKLPTKHYSHGMKKRVGLGLALLHNPKLLILDEPFSGLDITQTKFLMRIIKERSEKQQTTIISTHIVPYATYICQEALFITKGKLRNIKEWKSSNQGDREKLVESAFFC